MPRDLAVARSLSAGFLLAALAPIPGRVRQVTVTGTVVERRQSAPIAGAMVRLPGLPPVFTDTDGRFRIERVAPGRHTLTVEAFGYRRRSLDLEVRADTALRIELDPDPFVLDTLLVRPQYVTLRGVIRDARNRLPVLQAQVRVYPGFRTVGAVSGKFEVSGVPKGRPVEVVAEALEYLPARITLAAAADTALDIALDPDPVALRMIAQQVERLESRARAVPHSLTDVDRQEIRRSGALTVYELLGRLAPRRVVDPKGNPSWDPPCIFFDDRPIHIFDLKSVGTEGIERIEVYGFNGDMIRVYTRRFVQGMPRVATLPRIRFLNIGTGPPVCY